MAQHPKFKVSGKQRRLNTEAMASTRATESQWQLIETAIKAWIQQYPREWVAFQADLNRGRNKYNDAKDGDLKKSGFRNTAAFPVAYIRVPRLTESEVDSSGEFPVMKVAYDIEEDALLPVLKKIIPGLTDKKSVNYAEFLKRFPQFMPSEKTNAGKF